MAGHSAGLVFWRPIVSSGVSAANLWSECVLAEPVGHEARTANWIEKDFGLEPHRNQGRNWQGLALPIVILASILVIYLPLPAKVLDFFLAANLCISALILLTAIFVRSPLEFSLFPSLLLVTTLARIALNVATTRLILSRGHIDHELAAGGVVRAFGEFVAGNQLAVGMVIFLILFIVQFVVITSGTTRIGEVAARFALDGLPGRQMAIDADLNSGVITHDQARELRGRLLDSADFYGSMDGASKFVRGDAIAGLCITGINLIGGIIFGLTQGMPLTTAIGTFSTLTIGDGLASQLPALLISLAAGLLVSRGSSDVSFPETSLRQLTSHPIALLLTAGLMLVFAGSNMPMIPLFLLAATLCVLAWLVWGQEDKASAEKTSASSSRNNAGNQTLERMLETIPLTVELGSQLLIHANATVGGKLLERVSGLRTEIAQSLGLVMPKVRVRDNLQLLPDEFRILVDDHPILKCRIPEHAVLEIGPIGEDAKGASWSVSELPWAKAAKWVPGTSIDSESVARHLGPVDVIVQSVEWSVRSNAAEMLDRDSMRQLMVESCKQQPVLLAEALKLEESAACVRPVLQSLVNEGVPLRPLHRVLESILESQRQGQSHSETVEHCRKTLGRNICRALRAGDGKLPCFGLSEDIETRLTNQLDSGQPGGSLSPGMTSSLLRSVETGVRHMQASGQSPVILVKQGIRPVVSRLFQAMRPLLTVLGTEEVDSSTRVELIARIRLSDLQDGPGSSTRAA